MEYLMEPFGPAGDERAKIKWVFLGLINGYNL